MLMTYRVLNKQYGATVSESTRFLYQACQVVAVCGRRSRCSCTALHIPQYRLSTAGRRLFPVAAFIFWNTLPDDVQSALSVSSLWQQLKTFLFHQSFLGIIV